jgi:prepilin-type N-terminal cleavage/methylation domain-containing protein
VAADLVIVISALPERDDRGFTLVEVIVSLGILTVLLLRRRVLAAGGRGLDREHQLRHSHFGGDPRSCRGRGDLE